MLFKTIIPVLALSMAALPTISAWGVKFYADDIQNCGASESIFEYAEHYGSGGPSACSMAGDAVEDCSWCIDGGTSCGPCTQPMQPSPGSYYVKPGTCCKTGADSSCGGAMATCDQCIPLYIPVPGDGPFWFSCWDC